MNPLYPSPTSPLPRWTALPLPLPNGDSVSVRNDTYSDRIRCDHPNTSNGEQLGQALIDAARATERGRVVVLADAGLKAGLARAGLQWEATMPGFYRGKRDCVVFGYALSPDRAASSEPDAVARVDAIIRSNPPAKERRPVTTVRATAADAGDIATLIGATFEHYPTPSGVPDYIEAQILEGIPFRLVRVENEIVACASADLVRDALTAELTDCATRPDQRGGGFMQAILADLMKDLHSMGYPTAFTLARACIPGVNLAFHRLGFTFAGRMTRSCRIGDGLEDMNVWSRSLV